MKCTVITLVVCLAPGIFASSYNPVGKRDPFKPAISRPRVQPRGPLEQFDLDRLNLVAVIAGTPRPLALVEAPDGTQYAILVGTPIGRNQGRVIRITKDRVIVSEKVYDQARRKLARHRTVLTIEKDSEPAGTQGEKDPWATLRR